MLSDLNARLEEKGAVAEQHLSKDQIIEVVHETLQTVATASDTKKIQALKQGLGYVFLSDDSFERKQLLLHVLRGCTSIELAILPALYDGEDPYVVRERPSSTSLLPELSLIHNWMPTNGHIHLPQGHWLSFGNRMECGKEPLLTFLAKQIAVDEGATEGALRLLDGKGLTQAGPNLGRSDCKILLWQESANLISGPIISPSGSVQSIEVKPTPLEASKTKFGEDFLRFCHTR